MSNKDIVLVEMYYHLVPITDTNNKILTENLLYFLKIIFINQCGW